MMSKLPTLPAPRGCISFADLGDVTGIGKYRIGDAVKRAGVTVYRSPADARRKYIREEDVALIVGVRPIPQEHTPWPTC